jgi:predicted transcriptional regulator
MESFVVARQEMHVKKQKIMTNIKATNTMTDEVRASQEEMRTAMRAGQENMTADSKESKCMTSVASDRFMKAGRAIEPAGRKDSQHMIAVSRDDSDFDLDEDALSVS